MASLSAPATALPSTTNCLAHDLICKTLNQLCDFIDMHVLGAMNE